MGPGQPPLPIHFPTCPIFYSIFYFSLFPFLTRLIYFLTFSIPSLSTRIGPLEHNSVSICIFTFSVVHSDKVYCNASVFLRLVCNRCVREFQFCFVLSFVLFAGFFALLFLRWYYLLIRKRPEMIVMTSRTPVVLLTVDEWDMKDSWRKSVMWLMATEVL